MNIKQQGFTLIELLVTIAIAAIMATIALPNMTEWIASRRAASQAEQVANLLRFARSEAVRLNLPVYVCPAQIKKDGNPDNACNTKYSGQGIVAFVDTNNNKIYERSKDTDLRFTAINVHNQPKRLNNFIFTTDFNGNKTSDQQIWQFRPNGTFGHSASMSDKFTFSDGYVKIVLTDVSAQDDAAKKNRATVVIIDPSGRAEVCAKSDTRKVCGYSES
ncbi:GspH/FimT family pseudopilin [Neisseria chenwenguii]|uniref:Type II secretion system protein H n=1 Tax=Neisseria chenwenguii TaxID=1853278 RepID=A0A220S4L3_9NEIS|nr:GspH/FimT family pseudopilin [Neisseria chenwenguii]ASK28135.1 type II secretion system protein GspH [Neisseria chenwenguii]ROV57285.1 prepilin-type N-terminal cleavage/methylation domain-containing protein [Neisseria chenwenguii]